MGLLVEGILKKSLERILKRSQINLNRNKIFRKKNHNGIFGRMNPKECYRNLRMRNHKDI